MMKELSIIHRSLLFIIIHCSSALWSPRTINIGRALLLLFLILLPGSAQAQFSSSATWRLFESSDGMPTNDVWTVLALEDAIWIATLDGVSRYDGIWTNFSPRGPAPTNEQGTPIATEGVQTDQQGTPGLPELKGTIIAMEPGAQPGTIWAGAQSGEILFWGGSSWQLVHELSVPLHRLVEFHGNVYVATDHGLFVVNPVDGSSMRVPKFDGAPITALYSGERLWIGTNDGVYLLNGDDSWTRIGLPARFGTSSVTAILLDDQEYLWLGTPIGVTWLHLPTSTWAEKMISLTNEIGQAMPVFTLAKDLDGAVWAASNGGGARKLVDRGYLEVDVARVNGGELSTPLIRDVSVGVNGSVWFATPVGLFQYQAGRWLTDYADQYPASTRFNYVNELLVASDGTVWIATDGSGIRRKFEAVEGYRELVYDVRHGDLPHNTVYALAESHDGAVWAGTYDGLARYQDGTWTQPIAPESLPSSIVTDLLATPTRLWIGTNAGLAYLDAGSTVLTLDDTTRNNVIEALELDADGRLWAGTSDNGIYVLENSGQWLHMHEGDTGPLALPGKGVKTGGLARNPVTPHGMWAIIADVGLARFDGKEWRLVNGSFSSPAHLLYRLFTDPNDGSLWVGREGGVSHYDRVTWGSFTTQDGMQSSAIYAIAYEPDGKYWFGGAEGLTRYMPDRDRPWVRVGKPENMEFDDEGHLVIQQGVAAVMNIERGDLQTSLEELRLFFRMEGGNQWVEMKNSRIPLKYNILGPTSVDIMARDEAFNYSDIYTQPITVVPRTEYMNLPMLGPVERSIFWTLLFLATSATLGFSYVSWEIVQTHLRAIDALNRGFNPYVSGEPIRQGDMFFGRRALLQKIIDTLHNNSIMIHGERRIGKTSLLYQLANTLREVEDTEYRFLPVYIDLEGTRQDDFFHYLMEEIAVEVLATKGLGAQLETTVAALRYHDLPAANYGDREFAQDLRPLVNRLQREITTANRDQRLRLILLIDEVDVLTQYDQLIQQQLRRIFMRDFAATVGAIVAGIQISKDWDRVESPWFNMFNEIAMQPFDHAQAMELLVEPVRNIYSFEPAALEMIIELSNGRPYRLQQYALRSVNHMLQRRQRKILLEDVEAAHWEIETDSVPAFNSQPSASHGAAPTQ